MQNGRRATFSWPIPYFIYFVTDCMLHEQDSIAKREFLALMLDLDVIVKLN